MAELEVEFKDPDNNENFTVPWENLLTPLGLTIASSTFIVQPGLTKVSESNTTLRATVRLSGGTAETVYDVVNRVTCNDGQSLDYPFKIHVTAVPR